LAVYCALVGWLAPQLASNTMPATAAANIIWERQPRDRPSITYPAGACAGCVPSVTVIVIRLEPRCTVSFTV